MSTEFKLFIFIIGKLIAMTIITIHYRARVKKLLNIKQTMNNLKINRRLLFTRLHILRRLHRNIQLAHYNFAVSAICILIICDKCPELHLRQISSSITYPSTIVAYLHVVTTAARIFCTIILSHL